MMFFITCHHLFYFVSYLSCYTVKKGGECRETLIEIREGYGILAPKITHYCGYRKPRVLILDSGRLWLRFRSGSQRNHRMKGFILRFKSVCKYVFYRHVCEGKGPVDRMGWNELWHIGRTISNTKF